MYCKKCDANIQRDWNYCLACGVKVERIKINLSNITLGVIF